MALDLLPLPQYGQMSPFWKGGKFFLHISAILEDKLAFFGHFEGPEDAKIMKKSPIFSGPGPKKTLILDFLTKNNFF